MSHDEQLARWNQRFSGEDYLFGTAPNAFLASQRLLLRRGQTALAIADGEGRNGVFLAEQGLDVLSIDFSANGLAKAQRLARARGVTLRTEQVNLFAWDWHGRGFDVIAAIFIQFAPPDERALLFANIKQGLNPGGHLILQGYRPKQLEYGTGGPPNAENMYTEALLRRAFGDLTIVHLREHDEAIVEGTGHAGMSALIDLVARK
jgi:cyclopropane fatty-acyl-phospholipid synthase-like methyltransferase